MEWSTPEYLNRFYHDLQWNSLSVLNVGRVARVEMVLSLLSDLLEEQGQSKAAGIVREWQQNQATGTVPDLDHNPSTR
jgi:predicted alpha-1,6-mannanase (GH76 family)